MEVFILLILCLSQSLATQLDLLAYIKLPYEVVNGVPHYEMFRKSAQKAEYHATDRILYVTSGSSQKLLHLIDMEDPSNPNLLLSYEFSDNQDGLLTDVAVCGNTVAVSLTNSYGVSEGHVELFRAYNRYDPFVPLHRLSVGVHPKSLEFIYDCSRLIVANEGIPARDIHGNFSDPEAEVTIILMNGDENPLTIPIDFLSINNRVAELTRKGVRYVYLGDHLNGIKNTFSQDVEPEAITTSTDGQFAYVSLQENNAIVKINLFSYHIDDVYALGPKEWGFFQIDASDNNRAASFQTHAIYGLKQPGSIAYTLINGNGYIITADTGKIKTLTSAEAGVDFTDGRRCRTIDFDNLVDQPCMAADVLAACQDDTQLGRAFMSLRDGFNSRNMIQDIYLFGGRGISMWDARNLTSVYDSGDDFEIRAHQVYPNIFNGDCSDPIRTPVQQRDELSPETGPAPSVVKVADVNNTKLLLTGTKTGMIYMLSLSESGASFISLHRAGNTDLDWQELYRNNNAGDAVITDIGFIEARVSGSANPLVYAVGEASGSVSIYALSNVP